MMDFLMMMRKIMVVVGLSTMMMMTITMIKMMMTTLMLKTGCQYFEAIRWPSKGRVINQDGSCLVLMMIMRMMAIVMIL